MNSSADWPAKLANPTSQGNSDISISMLSVLWEALSAAFMQHHAELQQIADVQQIQAQTFYPSWIGKMLQLVQCFPTSLLLDMLALAENIGC